MGPHLEEEIGERGLMDQICPCNISKVLDNIRKKTYHPILFEPLTTSCVKGV